MSKSVVEFLVIESTNRQADVSDGVRCSRAAEVHGRPMASYGFALQAGHGPIRLSGARVVLHFMDGRIRLTRDAAPIKSAVVAPSE